MMMTNDYSYFLFLLMDVSNWSSKLLEYSDQYVTVAGHRMFLIYPVNF